MRAFCASQHAVHASHERLCCLRHRNSRLGPASQSRSSVVARTYQNEAESLYSGIPLQEGIINKRLAQKQMGADNKAYAAAMKVAEEDDLAEIMARRASRGSADTPQELVEYFLNTVAEDMDFEVARNRPKLDEEFFKHLDNNIGALRFTNESEEEKETLMELEALRDYLSGAVESIDGAVNNMASAKDRVAKLLASRDKKELILTMAENNEIDQPLMDLLNQNIQAARAAGQEDAAMFMEKVMQACGKYYVAAVKAKMPAPPTMPAAAAAGATIDVDATNVTAAADTAKTADGEDAARPAQKSSGSAPGMGISRGGIILPGGASSDAPPKPPPSEEAGGSGLIIPGR